MNQCLSELKASLSEQICENHLQCVPWPQASSSAKWRKHQHCNQTIAWWHEYFITGLREEIWLQQMWSPWYLPNFLSGGGLSVPPSINIVKNLQSCLVFGLFVQTTYIFKEMLFKKVTSHQCEEKCQKKKEKKHNLLAGSLRNKLICHLMWRTTVSLENWWILKLKNWQGDRGIIG